MASIDVFGQNIAKKLLTSAKKGIRRSTIEKNICFLKGTSYYLSNEGSFIKNGQVVQELEPFKGWRLGSENADVSKKIQPYPKYSPRHGNGSKLLGNV